MNKVKYLNFFLSFKTCFYFFFIGSEIKKNKREREREKTKVLHNLNESFKFNIKYVMR